MGSSPTSETPASNRTFRKLFEPFSIGPMKLRNRIVMPPMVTNFANEDGTVSERLKDWHEARARGGVGLIIVEATCIDISTGKGFARHLAADEDRFVPGLRDLADAVHRQGAKVAVQLHHAGLRSPSSFIGGQAPVTPSAIELPDGGSSRALTTGEIDRLVGRFAEAAVRARNAGFDGVEIHGAHGYLLWEFISRLTNRRTDSYGGSLRNRARFLLRVLDAVREAVGPDYPVWCRINAQDPATQMVEAGVTIEETVALAPMLEEHGANAINVSLGGVPFLPWVVNGRLLPPTAAPPGFMVPLAEAIRKAVSIPVIAVGRITPEAGELALVEGRVDLVAMGRALIADPDLPNKVAAGALDEIRPCILCAQCTQRVQEHKDVLCTANPTSGKERQSVLELARSPRKVLVVGGGPAGLEAASVAARRGHRVTLCEEKDALGGQLLQAVVPPYKEPLERLARYLIAQVKKAGVKVELGKGITGALVRELAPDAVVLATGMAPLVPEIPGVERGSVVTAEEVLTGRASVGESVIVIGGELVGCETAEFLADRGKQVTVARRGAGMALKMIPAMRQLLLDRLHTKGVTMLTGVKYEGITSDGLVITTREGERRTVAADTIVLAAGSIPRTALYRALRPGGPEAHLAGDSVEPRGIREALEEGFRIGLSL